MISGITTSGTIFSKWAKNNCLKSNFLYIAEPRISSIGLISVNIISMAFMRLAASGFLLFRKFSSDFAEKYRMPGIRLNQEAVKILEKYLWPGNIRQLKNVAEQISVIEKSRSVNKLILSKYLPDIDSDRNLPMVIDGKKESDHFSERDILYKVLFEMKQDVIEMKRVIVDYAKFTNEILNLLVE